MLDYIRVTLYTLLILLGFILFQTWEKEHPPAVLPTPSQAERFPSNHYVPTSLDTKTQSSSAAISPATNTAPFASPAKSAVVKVTTDTLDVTIDTRGGDIVEAKLLKFPESLHSHVPFVLFNDDPQTRYLAESGLLSKQGPDTSQEQALYTSSQANYVLANGQNVLSVKLNWEAKNGLKITKTFTFTRDSYEVKVAYDINNATNEAWEGSLYTQLLRTNNPPKNHSGMVNLTTYFGAAVSSPQKPFEKIPFKDMLEKNLDRSTQDGWAAMIQHYFISAWVPPKNTLSTYYSRADANGLYTIGMIGQPLIAAPGASISTEAKLYAGPAIADQLEKTAPGLKLTIDYGWFWFISGIIFWMMQKIYDVIGNWGWSIVFVTIIIKLLFYQLSAKSYRSMSAMKKLQPKIEILKERFGEDKQKFTQATLDLYRQEKVNPMSGCLPILIQIPVFIALYWVLVESVELRQAPFMFWIQDLSQQDPYYILPVLMGISMFIQQRLNPPPPDPLQAKMMMLMPVIFTVLFANFPAGLMLYWFVNNTLSFLQQWYIMRGMNKEIKIKTK
ncbi:MAG: membrane protein insertase YidC [Gammaproteobacteria bacterium]|nr:membrane protein insertase YidC [Gammaproteobacteria bacterium]